MRHSNEGSKKNDFVSHVEKIATQASAGPQAQRPPQVQMDA